MTIEQPTHITVADVKENLSVENVETSGNIIYNFQTVIDEVQSHIGFVTIQIDTDGVPSVSNFYSESLDGIASQAHTFADAIGRLVNDYVRIHNEELDHRHNRTVHQQTVSNFIDQQVSIANAYLESVGYMDSEEEE